MGFQYSGIDLSKCQKSMVDALESMERSSRNLFVTIQSAVGNSPWTGKTAEKYNSYFMQLYAFALAELRSLNNWLSNCVKMYYMFYAGYVDTDVWAKIYQDETDQLLEDLMGCDTRAETIQNAVEKQIQRVRNFTTGIYISDPGIADSIEAITNEIEDMYDRVDNAESAIEALMTGFDKECAAVGALIDVGLSSTVSETDWSIQIDKPSFDDAKDKVEKCYNNDNDKANANKACFSLADIFETESDEAHRRKQTEGIKILFDACVDSGKAAFQWVVGPWEALIGSVVFGLQKGAGDNAADQYGETGEIDAGEVVLAGITQAGVDVAKDGIGTIIEAGMDYAGLQYHAPITGECAEVFEEGINKIIQGTVSTIITETAASAIEGEKEDTKKPDPNPSVTQEVVEETIKTVLEDTGNGQKFKKRINQDKLDISESSFVTKEEDPVQHTFSLENGNGPVSMENIKNYEKKNRKMDSCYERPLFEEDIDMRR